MAVSLQKYLNNKLKEKGLTVAAAKKNAGKYKSIAAAKKAGSLYYTNKDGKVMAAVYAEDLKKPLKEVKPLKKSIFPKTRPSSGSIKVEVLLPGGDKTLNQVFDRMSREKNLPKPRATEIRLSTKNLNKFLKNPDSLTSIEKSRLKKTLKRAKIKIPKGL